MALLGFNFKKILAEKKTDSREKININNNVSIINVEQATFPIGAQTQEGSRIHFLFTTTYDPDFGTIELHGNLMYLAEEKEIKEIQKTWDKDKKLAPDLMKQVINAILGKCNIQALVMSRDVALPPPVPLPRVTVR